MAFAISLEIERCKSRQKIDTRFATRVDLLLVRRAQAPAERTVAHARPSPNATCVDVPTASAIVVAAAVVGEPPVVVEVEEQECLPKVLPHGGTVLDAPRLAVGPGDDVHGTDGRVVLRGEQARREPGPLLELKLLAIKAEPGATKKDANEAGGAMDPARRREQMKIIT